MNTSQKYSIVHPDLAEQVRREKVIHLYRASGLSPIVNVVICGLVVWILRDTQEREHLALWFISMCAVSLGRQILLIVFSRNCDLSNDKLWAQLFFVGAMASGFVWAVLPIEFYPNTDDLRVFEILVVSGVSAGSIASLFAVPLIAVSFLSVMILPMTARLFLMGSNMGVAMGLMSIIFYLFLIRSVRESNRAMVQNLRLRFEKESLAEDLAWRSNQLATTNEELLKALGAAREASRAKSSFLANMSHELRTPMNGVIGMTELALDLAHSEEQKEYLEIVQQSSKSLMDILDEILDLSKVESGSLAILHKPFLLRQEIEEIQNLFSVKVKEKQLALVVAIESGVPQSLCGDALRTKQILTNLLANAIKFTPEGGRVWLRVSMQERKEDQVLLKFEIEDTGIGVKEDDADRIFEKFIQVDDSLTRSHGGAGLGLPISKALVERMGGNIGVRQGSQGGALFYLTLEFEIGDSAEALDPTSTEACDVEGETPLRILVVEDNKINQKVIVRILERAGHRVSLVDDGVRAIELTEHTQFDLILMDCQLPVLDGYAVTRKIRERERNTGSHVCIVALTAHAMVGDRERCIEAGMDGYLTKPVQRCELRKVIRTAVAQSSPRT